MFVFRVYDRQEDHEWHTLQSTILIDEIEQDLHSLRNYKEAHNYISQVAPELSTFRESNVLPVAGDWPTWYFHKKIVCHEPEADSMIPEFGQFHVYLNGTEDVVVRYHTIFSEIYKAVFGQRKVLPLKPKPDKVTLCITLAFAGWLQIRDDLTRAFGQCKDVEYACLYHLFDELVPLNFIHYPVVVRGGNFQQLEAAMKRLSLMFIAMDRHHYNKASLSWISDTKFQRESFPDYLHAKQDLCSVITEKKVEIFHSKIRSRIDKNDKAPKIQETARLLARSSFDNNLFEQDYVNEYPRGISNQNLLLLTGIIQLNLFSFQLIDVLYFNMRFFLRFGS